MGRLSLGFEVVKYNYSSMTTTNIRLIFNKHKNKIVWSEGRNCLGIRRSFSIEPKEMRGVVLGNNSITF